MMAITMQPHDLRQNSPHPRTGAYDHDLHQVRHYLGLCRDQGPPAIVLVIMVAIGIATAGAASLAGLADLGIVAGGAVAGVGLWLETAGAKPLVLLHAEFGGECDLARRTGTVRP